MFYEENKLLITPETKIGDLLEAYPGLEDKLIEIAPVFSKLKNPVLRKTVAKVTTIRHAAVIGNVDLYSMLNGLRKTAGQEIMEVPSGEIVMESAESKPIAADITYDARTDLAAGIHPVAKVFKGLKEMGEGKAYKIITPFYPAPLIDKAKAQGFSASTIKVSPDCFETCFVKEPGVTDGR